MDFRNYKHFGKDLLAKKSKKKPASYNMRYNIVLPNKIPKYSNVKGGMESGCSNFKIVL